MDISPAREGGSMIPWVIWSSLYSRSFLLPVDFLRSPTWRPTTKWGGRHVVTVQAVPWGKRSLGIWMKEAYSSLHPVRSREFGTVKASAKMIFSQPRGHHLQGRARTKGRWASGCQRETHGRKEVSAWRGWLSQMPRVGGRKGLPDQRWMQPKSSLLTPELGRGPQPNALGVTSVPFPHHFLLAAGAPQSQPS